jgi:DNA polymerase
MQLITLDFETYYDSEYTLKQLTTEAYVRDPRFKVHCACGTIDGKYPAVLTSYPGKSFSFADCISSSAVLCHHAHFDGLILRHHYGLRPAFWFDTLSMARLALPHLKSHSLASLAEYFRLPQKTVPYNEFMGKRELSPEVQKRLEAGCIHDVELTYQIFKKLLPRVSQEELRVIDLTIRMFTEPALQLDKERMNVYMVKILADKSALLQQVGVTTDELASASKFAECLKAIGAVPPTKISPRTGKQTYALAKTDVAFKELCDSEDEMVTALCAARLGVKSTLAESRTGRLLSCAERGPLPVYLKYYGAHTGRWSGGDKLNWQNFPRGGEIRRSILAPDGYVLCVIDLAQIECRMLNWLAGQEDVLQAFRDGRDLYCEAASRFYGRAITKADKEERQIFKSVELGCGYGMGHVKFKDYARASGSTISEGQARELIQFYRQTHPKVVEYWKRADNVLVTLSANFSYSKLGQWGPISIEDGSIVYPNGGYQIFTNLHIDENNEWKYTIRGHETKIYGALLVENVTQALSRVLLSRAMLKISEKYKVVMSTHDEVVYLAPEKEADEALAFGMRIFTTNPEWCKTLPLAAEGGYDKRYSK